MAQCGAGRLLVALSSHARSISGKRESWLDAMEGEKSHFTRKRQKLVVQWHVIALPFRVSLRHAASQLSSRFPCLDSANLVNAAWIALQLAFWTAGTLHFWFISPMVPALAHGHLVSRLFLTRRILV